MAQAHSKLMREDYGDLLDKSYKGKTFSQRAAGIEKKNIESFAGMADKDIETNADIFYANAFLAKVLI